MFLLPFLFALTSTLMLLSAAISSFSLHSLEILASSLFNLHHLANIWSQFKASALAKRLQGSLDYICHYLDLWSAPTYSTWHHVTSGIRTRVCVSKKIVPQSQNTVIEQWHFSAVPPVKLWIEMPMTSTHLSPVEDMKSSFASSIWSDGFLNWRLIKHAFFFHV